MDRGEGPRELTLYATGACDAACSFCKRETDEGMLREGTVTVDLVREVLDRFPTLVSCCIAGFGEPLLVKHLGEIVALLRSRGVYVGIVTNGSRLLARLPEVRGWDLGHLSVSLNAADPIEHRNVFGTGAWDDVLLGIEGALSAGLRVGASFVVTRRKVPRVPFYLDLAARLRLRFAHLHNLLPHDGPRSLSFLGPDGAVREDDREARQLWALRKLWEAEDPPRVPEVSWPEPVPRESLMRCQSPFVSIGVDARGSVTACRRVQEPRPEHGSFRDPGVWTGHHFSAYRDALSGRAPASPLLETCRACFGSARG